MTSLVWISALMYYLHSKRAQFFPENLTLEERHAKNPVPAFFWTGFGASIIARTLVDTPRIPVWVIWAGFLLGFIGVTFFVLATARMAYKRGRSWWWSLLGTMGPIGPLIVLIMGKKKNFSPQTPAISQAK